MRPTNQNSTRKPLRYLLSSVTLILLFQALQTTCIAQMIDDGIMVPGKTLFGGYLFTHDSWNQYWEGPLKRANGNIGTLTTETSTVFLNYGVTDSLNILATIPYVMTNSSQGVLAGQQGWQDFTLAAKYRLPELRVGHLGTLAAYAVPFWGIPMTDYTPDFQPLSIGLGSRRAGIRSTMNLQSNMGMFVNVSGAYTWRGEVDLDRPYYFTNNQFFMTNVVDMADVVDYSASAGYFKRSRMAQFTFSKLITQGGADVGDIRRQDLPFVANRFISSRIGTVVQVPIPKFSRFAFRFEYSYVIAGRNVGQSSTFTTGLMRTQSFRKQ
jgi:hypothetical protein